MSNKLRVVSRDSNLAMVQVKEFFSRFPGIEYENTAMKSYGDRHREISLVENTMKDFFTKELDEALLEDRADIAVHSAKDLPFPLPEGLEVVTLLPPFDRSDALVSKGNVLLKDLAQGAKIGVSSENRIRQLLEIRPDVVPVQIRGNIEERAALVTHGEVDGVIIATCALKRLGMEDCIAEILLFKTHPLQGFLAATARTGRPGLKGLFALQDCRNRYGTVWLVGAGPGDPELLTLKGDRLLKKADVILYDALVNPQLLGSYGGEKIFTGKRKGAHFKTQEQINELLCEKALEGKRVVRLKGGDPMIFGRAAEEIDYLTERFISVEVVPGITTALGAAAGYGMPLTLRGEAGSVSFITAHHRDDQKVFVPLEGTLVYYMGASKLGELSARLVEKGRTPDTPVALISSFGLYAETVKVTTVGCMGESALKAPLLIIVGKVVRRLRLTGLTLITGLGNYLFDIPVPGRKIHYPLIEVVYREKEPLPGPGSFDAVVFTSKEGVKAFLCHHFLGVQKIFAIGRATADVLENAGYSVDFIPYRADSETLCEFMKEYSFSRVLYPCSGLSKNRIHSLPGVTTFPVYDINFKNPEKIEPSRIVGVVFTSPSTVEGFFRLYGVFPGHILYYVMGNVTEKSLLALGVAKERIINVQEIQAQAGK